MSSKLNFLAPTFAVAFAGAAFGQADECVNATDLGTGASSTPFDTNVAVDTGVAATDSAENTCGSSGDVWFKYTASLTGTATISTCNNGTFDTEVGVYEGGDCSTMVNIGCNDDFTGCASFTSLIEVPVTAGTVYHINIGHFSTTIGTFGAGTLDITEALPPVTPPNDTCATPSAFGAAGSIAFDSNGATSSLFAGASAACVAAGANGVAQDMFYTFTIPSAGDWSVNTAGSLFDTQISVYSGSDCAATCIATNDDANGTTQSEVVLMGAMAGDQILVQVGGFSGGGTGTLTIDLFVDPCPMPDAFEDNDDCASAVAISDGTYTGLGALLDDQDYYAVSVPAGNTLDATIFFTDDDGDLDLYLWDPLVDCDTNVAGTAGAFLVRGFSVSDDETITYTNTTGADQNLIIEVDVWNTSTCNTYDLMLSGTGATVIGTNYCMANNNSTGVPAVMSASGSSVAANNNLTLEASNLPANTVGFFLNSLTQGFVPNPAGSQGNLCLGGAIGRYQMFIQNAGAAGEYSLLIDLTAVPQPTGSLSVMAGDTLNFQSWFRDAVGGMAVSNFTDGLSITFQ